MTSSFSNLSLAPELARAVAEMGYETMTPIQEQAIPVVLQGKDVMGAAQTGTGKTAAFALPLLQRMMKHENASTSPARHPVRALVLLPTRELAVQVAEQLAEAVAMGAKVLAGGTVETLGGGKYLRPTVLTDVTPMMRVVRDETFGPVIPVTLFDTVEEAVALANDSIYGLSAAVIGDSAEAIAVAERLEAGAISINDGSMTAGVWDAENSSFKLSGMGPSRMGDAGLTRFFRTQALIRQTGTVMPIAAYAEDASW